MTTTTDGGLTALRQSLEARLGDASRAWLHEALAEAGAEAEAQVAPATVTASLSGPGGHTTEAGAPAVHTTEAGAPAVHTTGRGAPAADTAGRGIPAGQAQGGVLPTWEARFAEAGRHCRPQDSSAPAPAAAAASDPASAARVLLLCAARADRATVHRLYSHGSAAERKAVLLALPHLGHARDGSALPLVEDALRANDTRLITAAVGPYAALHLEPHAWRHAVLKCLFTGVPVDAVHQLAGRAGGDGELARMLTDYAAERSAAGRPVPADLHHVLSLTGRAPAPQPASGAAPVPAPAALPEES